MLCFKNSWSNKLYPVTNQKGGMFKPTGVDHEVIVDPNDMKDAPTY